MKKFGKIIAFTAALASLSASFTACGSSSDDEVLVDASDTVTTTQATVAINTETLAPEQDQQVADLADSLTGELTNKTVKWLSFYDPWHPTGTGNTKPVSVELFEKKYGGEIEYIPTTWANQFNDLSTNILGGEGIDFFPAVEAVPKCAVSGMTQPYDEYIDWENPLWQQVKDLNDMFELNGKHYLMACQATEGYVVYYNKKTIEENGLDDPKELYENGEWTLSKFKEMLADFVDPDEGMYGLDGWFNCTPLYLASGVPAVSIENGRVKSNLMDPAFERAMQYQSDLYTNGLILDKSLFSWNTQIQYIGEGKELFYISGLYEIESAPELWTKTFGNQEDVFFVPVPRDENADEYYYNAEIDCYNLCKGAQNPEGVARLMECIIASYYDENSLAISDEKHKNDYGWSDEMLEMKKEVHRLTIEHPVKDIYGGLPDDASSLISDSVNQPLNGNDWYSVRDSVNDTVNNLIDEVNSRLEALN